jgi:hypothetical protein
MEALPLTREIWHSSFIPENADSMTSPGKIADSAKKTQRIRMVWGHAAALAFTAS